MSSWTDSEADLARYCWRRSQVRFSQAARSMRDLVWQFLECGTWIRWTWNMKVRTTYLKDSEIGFSKIQSWSYKDTFVYWQSAPCLRRFDLRKETSHAPSSGHHGCSHPPEEHDATGDASEMMCNLGMFCQSDAIREHVQRRRWSI